MIYIFIVNVRSPIPAPPELECEMSLRQFGSVTDLLTKLRADLRASFPRYFLNHFLYLCTRLDGISKNTYDTGEINVVKIFNVLLPKIQGEQFYKYINLLKKVSNLSAWLTVLYLF